MSADEPPRPKAGSFEEAWSRQVLSGLAVAPVDRLRLLEEAILFASRAGAATRRQLLDRQK